MKLSSIFSKVILIIYRGKYRNVRINGHMRFKNYFKKFPLDGAKSQDSNSKVSSTVIYKLLLLQRLNNK
jgi:hypothetical protein